MQGLRLQPLSFEGEIKAFWTSLSQGKGLFLQFFSETDYEMKSSMNLETNKLLREFADVFEQTQDWLPYVSITIR